MSNVEIALLASWVLMVVAYGVECFLNAKSRRRNEKLVMANRTYERCLHDLYSELMKARCHAEMLETENKRLKGEAE